VALIDSATAAAIAEMCFWRFLKIVKVVF
jgi:hypothetical protein